MLRLREAYILRLAMNWLGLSWRTVCPASGNQIALKQKPSSSWHKIWQITGDTIMSGTGMICSTCKPALLKSLWASSLLEVLAAKLWLSSLSNLEQLNVMAYNLANGVSIRNDAFELQASVTFLLEILHDADLPEDAIWLAVCANLEDTWQNVQPAQIRSVFATGTQ
ncbi:hypothetical protein WJX74_009585 [Apatococcus lobatus]|uniref:Uncharacterized protein n=1 Tax=Apatococcus lobatus TaxID=904363 RepID=A0AAW1SHI4_9CHLO